MTSFLEVDDLTPAEFAAVLDAALCWKREPVADPEGARRLGRGAAVREAVGPHPRVHRDGRGRARRPPDLHPARRGRARRARAGRRRRPHARGILRGDRGAGVRPRDARGDGAARSTCRSSTCCPTARIRARRSPTSSRCASCSATSRAARLVFVGDGNNVAASLAFAAALSGVELTVASPSGYELDDDTVERARNLGGAIELAADPYEAVRGADAVYTDVWTSMGQEEESVDPARRVRGLHRRRGADGRGGGAGVVPALPARAPRRRGGGRGDRRPALGGVAAGREPDGRRARAARAAVREPTRTLDDARQAATAAPHRAAPRGAGDLEPGAAGRDARLRRRGRDAGHGQPRPRGARRGEGAHPRRRDGVRDPRARQGGQRARRPSAPRDGRVRGGGRVQREPRGAAHAARFRPRGGVRRSTAPGWPTCSAPSPATTRSWWCAPSTPAARTWPPSSARLAGL